MGAGLVAKGAQALVANALRQTRDRPGLEHVAQRRFDIRQRSAVGKSLYQTTAGAGVSKTADSVSSVFAVGGSRSTTQRAAFVCNVAARFPCIAAAVSINTATTPAAGVG